jgi:hypothetical protein
MILRTKPRIRDRLLRLSLTRLGKICLLLGAACAAANAAPPAPAPPTAAPPAASPTVPSSASSATGAPDESFLEFLGSDDVGDAAWWDFLKKAPPRGNVPPAPPAQEAKQ